MRRKRGWETTPPADSTGPSVAAASRLASPLGPDDPARLGRYVLVGRLGEGGMGTVYLGRDPSGRMVAVKVVRADLARLPEFRTRFQREADLARRVARFCTAEVLDVVDPPDGQPYLVTEYVDGLTLAQAVAVEGPLRSADLERVAVSVAAALTAIHGAGMVHRDLKPSNVLLSTLGPRVIDFGIARALDAQTMVSQEIQRIGTPAFMAPEQANGEPVTSAADIFAWGGLVTYAGTGSYPFGDGPTPVQLYRVVHREPLLDGLDPALRPIVEQAMRKNPAERPTAQELFLRLVGMGPATHPDPDVSAAIQTTNAPIADPAPPVAPVGQPGNLPLPDLTSGIVAASAPRVVTGVPAQPAPEHDVATGPRPPAITGAPDAGGHTGTGGTGGSGGIAGTGGAVGSRTGGGSLTGTGTGGRPSAGPAGTGDVVGAGAAGGTGGGAAAGAEAGASRVTRLLAATTRRRIVLFAVPLLALLLIAALIPLAFTGGGRDERQTRDSVARRVAAMAESIRDSDTGRAARLSLAAFRISPVPEARASLRTSFSPATATVLTGHTESVLGLGVSPDGRTVATGGADNLVRLWDVTDRSHPRELATLTAHSAWVLDAAFSPDGKLLATVSYDRTVRLWDIHDLDQPRQLAVLLGHDGYVLDAAFSPNGRILATSGYDNTARLWDIRNPESPHQLAVLNRHTSWVNEVSFSPNGKLLATASADRTARLWDISDPSSPRPLAAITAHTDYVWAVAFSPDGKQLATGAYDGLVKLWDVTDPARPRATASIVADEKWVFDLAYSPDGHTLATAGWDTTAHLWDLSAPGKVTAAGVISGHGDWVQGVEFMPNGESLVTISDDYTTRISRIDDAGLVARACADPANQITQADWQRDIADVPYQPVC
ncbi:serine/threonine protein kinase [Frankia sp. CcI49]|nr:serine/threonine protein kinase [Frankia sp. CcI49]